jgi:hypothetical protein
MVSSGMLRRVDLVRTDSVRRLLVAACVVPSSQILITLMKEAPGSSDTTLQTLLSECSSLSGVSSHRHLTGMWRHGAVSLDVCNAQCGDPDVRR